MKIIKIEISEADAQVLHKVVKEMLIGLDALPIEASEGLNEAIVQNAVVEWVKRLEQIVMSTKQTKIMFDSILEAMPDEVKENLTLGSLDMGTRNKIFDDFLSSLDPEKVADMVNDKLNKEVH
jgi:hypothetical protein